MEGMGEEHSGEDGLLEEAKTDKGNITARSVEDRLKAIQDDPDALEERTVLEQYLALIEQEVAADKKLKAAQKALAAKVATKYAQLSEAEIKTLVVHDKWLATLAARVERELDRVWQGLSARIRRLAERYATPLPVLTAEVGRVSACVDQHLRTMGSVW